VEWQESQIAEWRALVAGDPVLDAQDVDELEAHLRDQVAELSEAGLSDDEAFLVAVKRIGKLDVVSREFARENRGKLWRQLVFSDTEESDPASRGVEAVVFAVASSLHVCIC
jgi:hypothetical protein